MYYNSRNSAKSRLEKGRVSAGIHDIKVEDIMDLWNKQDGKCAISGIPMNYDINEFRLSIDRIDNDLGYIKENIRLVPIEINSVAGWSEEKIIDMLRILDMGIEENPVCFDIIKTQQKEYDKQKCVVIDGCDHYNCTLCGIVKPFDQFYFKTINGCKDCVKNRYNKTKEDPRGMIQALLQGAKNSTNIRKAKNTAYKRDHTFDIDFDFHQILPTHASSSVKC